MKFVLPPTVFVVESFIYVDEGGGDGDGGGKLVGETDGKEGIKDGREDREREEKDMVRDGGDTPVAAAVGP